MDNNGRQPGGSSVSGYLLGLLLLGGGIGLAGSEERRFERAAAAEIGSRLGGEGRQVSVNARPLGVAGAWGELESVTIRARGFSVDGLPLYTEPERSKKGIAKSLRLELEDFYLGGLKVESLSASFPSCRYDFAEALAHRRFRLSRCGKGTATVRVLAESLPEFLLKKYPEISDITVRVEQGHVWVEGKGTFLVVTTRFNVIAKLGVEDGDKLVLTDAKVWFDWRRTDALTTQVVLDALNPVVDLAKDLHLDGAMSVEKIELPDGAIVAHGAAQIPVKAASGGTSTGS